MKRSSVVLLMLGLVMAAALPASASTFLAMSQEELIQASSSVVRGTVVEVRSFWEPTGRVIVSEAVVDVEEALVGEAGSRVVVRTFGGTVDKFTVDAHGFPKFEVDDKVLLFLEPENDGVTAKVTGYQQGHFRVVVDPRGTELAVPTVDAGSHLLSADGSPAPTAKTVPFESLKETILELAGRAGRLEK